MREIQNCMHLGITLDQSPLPDERLEASLADEVMAPEPEPAWEAAAAVLMAPKPVLILVGIP